MYIGDWMFVIFIIIMLWKIKITKGCHELNEEYLGIQNSNAVKGLFALVPLFVHIGNITVTGHYADWWGTYGNVAVAGYFFYTGFGLMKQYMRKDNYSKGFLVKHYPKILLPYIAITCCCVVTTFFFKGFLYPVSGVFHAIKCGDPIVPYSWYVIHLLVFYLWFYLAMKLCKNHYGLLVFSGALYYVLTTIFVCTMSNYYDGYGGHWFQSSWGLFLGMLVAYKEKEIFEFAKKYYFILLTVTVALMLTVYELGVGPVADIFPPSFSLYNVVVRVLMLLVILVLLMRAQLGNPILSFLGAHTLEIYLVQGLIIQALISGRFGEIGDNLMALLVVALTFVCAVIMKQCMKLVFKLLRI